MVAVTAMVTLILAAGVDAQADQTKSAQCETLCNDIEFLPSIMVGVVQFIVYNTNGVAGDTTMPITWSWNDNDSGDLSEYDATDVCTAAATAYATANKCLQLTAITTQE